MDIYYKARDIVSSVNADWGVDCIYLDIPILSDEVILGLNTGEEFVFDQTLVGILDLTAEVWNQIERIYSEIDN